MNAPSERKLKEVERELKKLARGAQRSVGGGVYMRLDKSGNRRFQFRTRADARTAGQPAGTFDTWSEAYKQLGKVEDRAGKMIDETTEELRRLTIAQYYDEHFLPYVEDNLDSLTEVDYTGKFERDCRVFWCRYTFEDVDSAPMLGDRFRTHLKDTHTYPELEDGGNAHPQAGELFSPSACDGAIKVVSSLFSHAQRRGILRFNPMDSVPRFRKKRRKSATAVSGGSHTKLRPKEMLHPRIVVRAAAGVRGSGAMVEERRGLIEVLGFEGTRPSEALAMRHRHWRNVDGTPKLHLELDEAVKEPWGHIEVGEPKTGVRDPYLWPAVAEQLERIYQAQGCPSLDALVFPNANGDHLSWTNWRGDVWYPALVTAGIAAPPPDYEPPASGEKYSNRQRGLAKWPGAFRPYEMRHCVASMMLHARRPDEQGGGTYTVIEVARQLGHDPRTLLAVYAEVMHDIHGISGMTMNEIIHAARREVWGPLPGDHDFEDDELTTVQASLLTGISVSALGVRILRGGLPARKERGKYLISRHELRWRGLIPLNNTIRNGTRNPRG
jgi:integrase